MSDTTPFRATPQHEAFGGILGRWSGPTKTWLDPSADPEVTTTELTAEAMLGGRWLRLAYRGRCTGKPHAGEMIVGYHVDAKAHEIAWVDSFHTGSAIMLSTGALREDVAPSSTIDVLGSYAAGEQRWGWRTVIRLIDDALVIEAFNISPDGQESPAVETRLARVG